MIPYTDIDGDVNWVNDFLYARSEDDIWEILDKFLYSIFDFGVGSPLPDCDWLVKEVTLSTD